MLLPPVLLPRIGPVCLSVSVPVCQLVSTLVAEPIDIWTEKLVNTHHLGHFLMRVKGLHGLWITDVGCASTLGRFHVYIVCSILTYV